MTIIKIFDKYPEIFKRISSYIIKNINEIYNKENVSTLLDISFDKQDGFAYMDIVYRPCELYAKLKTWHLLTLSFRLVADNNISNSSLKLHERNFPMFRRYQIII